MIGIYEQELKAAIYAAIQQHGQAANLRTKNDGTITLIQWLQFVRKDGHKPPDIHRWLTAGNGHWAVEPLLRLAEIFRFYEVKVGEDLMPHDYFVSILVNGVYKELDKPSVDCTDNLSWLKKGLKNLDGGDRLAVLGWFSGMVGQSLKTSTENTAKTS